MQIPSYQIQNVLKVYSRQVSQGKILARNKNGSKMNFADSVSISSEGKRRLIIDRVTDEIVDKIITEGTSQSSAAENDTPDAPITYKHPAAVHMKDKKAARNSKEFTYTVIDKENKKTSQTLSVMDPQFISIQPGPKNPIDPINGSEEEINGGQIS